METSKSKEKINDWKIEYCCGIETCWWTDKKAVIEAWNKRVK